jgi:hypothetical protein
MTQQKMRKPLLRAGATGATVAYNLPRGRAFALPATLAFLVVVN